MSYKAICLSVGLCCTISMHAMQQGPLAWLVLLGVAPRPVVFNDEHRDHAYRDERNAVHAQQFQVRDSSRQQKKRDQARVIRPKIQNRPCKQPQSQRRRLR